MSATHYQVLDISRRADADQIRHAWRRQVMLHHPDRNPHLPDAEETLKIINIAYTVLSDPVQRTRYDAELKAARQQRKQRRRNRAPRHRKLRWQHTRDGIGWISYATDAEGEPIRVVLQHRADHWLAMAFNSQGLIDPPRFRNGPTPQQALDNLTPGLADLYPDQTEWSRQADQG